MGVAGARGLGERPGPGHGGRGHQGAKTCSSPGNVRSCLLRARPREGRVRGDGRLLVGVQRSASAKEGPEASLGAMPPGLAAGPRERGSGTCNPPAPVRLTTACPCRSLGPKDARHCARTDRHRTRCTSRDSERPGCLLRRGWGWPWPWRWGGCFQTKPLLPW